MKLYVSTYRKYNDGSLKGEWVDLDDFVDKSDFMSRCHEIHDDEDKPEFMFQDYEEDIDGEGDFWYNECHISSKYWEFTNICERNSLSKELAYLYLNHIGSDDPDDLEGVNCYSYDSYEDYILEISDIPDWIIPYVNFSDMREDSEETIIDYDGQIFIFR